MANIILVIGGYILGGWGFWRFAPAILEVIISPYIAKNRFAGGLMTVYCWNNDK